MIARAVATMIVTLVLIACGGSERRSQASPPPTTTVIPTTEQPPAQTPPPSENTLVFRRVDGSVIEMPGQPTAWCGPDDAMPGAVLQVAAIMGVKRTADEWFSYWHVWAIPKDVEGGKQISFPLDPTWDGERGAQIFVGDSETQGEASSAGEDSHGQIVFSEVSCEIGAPIEFTIDAVIDSEFFDGDPVKATGTFRGVLEHPPEDY